MQNTERQKKISSTVDYRKRRCREYGKNALQEGKLLSVAEQENIRLKVRIKAKSDDYSITYLNGQVQNPIKADVTELYFNDAQNHRPFASAGGVNSDLERLELKVVEERFQVI